MQYLVYGDQKIMLEKAINEIIKKSLPNKDDFNLFYYDAKETPLINILQHANTANFFIDKKVIIIKDCYFFTSELPKLSFENDLGLLENYLSNPNDSTDIIFMVEAEKLDERKKIVKIIKEKSKVLAIASVSKQELPKFIRTIFDKREVTISSEALNEFINRVGTDIQHIAMEADKLALYSKNINLVDIENLITPIMDDNVFQLADALIAKDFKKTINIYNNLKTLNIEPISLINMIARQFRNAYLVLALTSKKYSIQEIAKTLGIHPYPVQLILERNKINIRDKFLKVLYDLAELDISIKLDALDKFTRFEYFLIKTCL